MLTGHNYQIWRIKYPSPNDDVRTGFTCDPQFASILINSLGEKSDPDWDTHSWNEEATFKKWKEYSILHLPVYCRDMQGRINMMNTWWVNHKNKDKSSFLDNEGKDPWSTTQLGLYTVYVCVCLEVARNAVSNGQILASKALAGEELAEKELATHKAEMEEALAVIPLNKGEKLTIEAINDIKPSKEIKELCDRMMELWDRMMERSRDESGDN